MKKRLLLIAAAAMMISCMTPKIKTMNIMDTAVKDGEFRTLVTYSVLSDMMGTLTGAENFTLFAPTDEAFDRLSPDINKALMDDEEKLKELLQSHLVPGRITACEALRIKELTNLRGETIRITTEKGKTTVNGIEITEKDMRAKNGIIHRIDGVIIP